MAIGVYGGSFDPPTNGHLDVIAKGAGLFEKLYVVIAMNSGKQPLFSAKERKEMLLESIGRYKNVEVAVIQNELLVDFADAVGANYLLRGMRNETDFGYEETMNYLNEDIASVTGQTITSIYVFTARDNLPVSSSWVKSLMMYTHGVRAVQKYVPENVYLLLCEKFGVRT